MKPSVAGAVLGFSFWFLTSIPWSVDNQVAGQTDTAAQAEEEKQRQAAERFQGVLEKNPRRGTALDRLYGYHVEAGTLDAFVHGFEGKTQSNPKDGAAWMILGLIEAQRGRDAKAVEAFRQAESVLPESPLASYYLGQSLVLVGQPDEAAEAFERAIVRKPQRIDLLEIFQSLGRVYQRAQKGDQALAVWNRLEKLFPDDPRVQEQIATTLAEEGQHELALPRFEGLAKQAKDEYRAATYRIESADLKVRLGRTEEALADFESLLAKLNPDNWLYRDVRRRIDETFLRNDDQAGLAAYYEGWIDRNAEDVEAMARLARILVGMGRTPEAQSWFDKALQRAPSRRDLRLAFIEQLVADKRYPQAIEQYELLAKNDPSNPDALREWGRLILKDSARAESERKAAASAVWRKLLEARPKDSLTATQVADLFRHAEMADEAIELYTKAIELSPEAPQYREYLGEYYHVLKRSDEALATWREIVAGKKRTPENLARLAEVLAGFGYLPEAVDNILAAAKADDDEFKYPVKAAELLGKSQKYDEALTQLDIAEKLADSSEDRETVLQARIRNLQLADKLQTRAVAIEQELAAGTDVTADRWYLLARYREAARELPEAARAIARALALDEKSIPYQAAQARIQESAGSLREAADSYRKLATIDRRLRTGHLTQVARLEAQLGRVEQALTAGRDLLEAAPGNAENYEFFAQLCFQLGKTEEGLEALRRSVRLNPTEPRGMLTLANALTEQFRTDEAIELYWRAFEKSPDLDAKLGIVPKLADLYLQTNHFERLTERFERERREQAKLREMTICLAQAYHSAGDFGTARQELERLLSQNVRDTQLLQQLGNLAEAEGDLPAAMKYQQQLNSVAPGKEGESRMAQLLTRSGQTEEAAAIWLRMALEEDDPAKVLSSVDNLLAHERRDTARTITERVLRDQPQNWEMLYREGVSLALDNAEEAGQRFRALLAIRLPDDKQGAQAKARAKQAQNRPAPVSARYGLRMRFNPIQDRLQNAYQIRRVVGLDADAYYYQGQQQMSWGPSDFGQARMAALGWLFRFSGRGGKQDEFLAAMRNSLQKPDPDSRDLWDWYYLQQVRQDQKEVYEAGRRLSKLGDPLAQWLYLSTLSNRTINTSGRRSASQGQGDTTPPLAPDEMDFVLACYQSIQQKRPELLADYMGTTVVSNVLAELKRAQRTDDETRIYRSVVDRAARLEERSAALQLAAGRGDLETAMVLFEKISEELMASSNRSRQMGYYGNPSNLLQPLLNARAEAGAFADMLSLLDKTVTMAQRVKEATPVTAPANRRRATGPTYPGGGMYVGIQIGKQHRGVRIDYPSPNDYYDHGAIVMLRTAFEYYKQNDLLSDLFAHFKARSSQAGEASRLWYLLGLDYLYWWNEQQEQAVAELQRAVDLVPADQTLRLELAGLYERRQDFEAALTTVEAITPLDHQTMQQRETSALRLAVRTGDVDRARQAAERLFGLRLDAETQVQLAAEMRSLGMNEQAEAVLSRARRQAGNRVAALVSLMLQYQAEQKPELAVQVAHQILRRGSPSGMLSSRVRYSNNEDEGSRQQALSVLARSGKLKDLIERVEAQLKASPSSTQLYQSLVEYYQAAGDREKSFAALLKQAEIRPEDSKLRFQIAQQLTQSGKAAEAIEHYKFAVSKDPGLLARSFHEVQQAYRQANKATELVDLLESIDLKAMGQYWYVTNVIQELSNDDKNRALAMKLFKKSWEAFPEQRPYILSSLYREEFWQMPEILDYAREAVIPRDSGALTDSWSGVDQVHSYSGDGKVTGMMTRLIEAAVKQNRLPALQQEIDDQLKKAPTWSGGKALLAVIHARGGKPELARPLIESLVADKKNPVPMNACWLIGQEIENYDATRPLAILLYESTLSMPDNRSLNFSYSPLRRLAGLYQKAGQIDKAREMVLKLSRGSSDENYDPGYAAYRRIENLSAIGNQLVELGYPVDAIRMYSQVFDNEENLRTAAQYGGDYYLQQARQGYAKALASATAKNVRGTITTLLDPKSGADRKSGEPAIDLVLLVQPPELNRAEITSMLARVLQEALATADLRQEVRAKLADLAGQFPEDFQVQVLVALGAFAAGESEALRPALERFQAFIDRTPLEELPAGGRANSRQRQEAAHQIGLWLVARQCLKSDEYRAVGEKWAERSLAAARRQAENKQALAMLREWGQIAFDQGDRVRAEVRFTEMLDLVLPPPAVKPAAALPAAQRAPAASPAAAGNCDDASSSCDGEAAPAAQVKQAPARQPAQPAARIPRAAPGQPGAPSRGPTIPPATLTQFTQAVDISRLAAEHGMTALSLRAVRQALLAGPPVKAQPAVQGGSFGFATPTRVVRGMGGRAETDDQAPVFKQVADQLSELAGHWTKAQIPPADQYAALVAIVLPEARPAEMFLYPHPIATGDLRSPRSVGKLLAAAAVKGNQVDDLRNRIAGRQSQPLSKLPGEVLLALLANESGNPQAARDVLGALQKLLESDTLRSSAELACHVAFPALEREDLAEVALPVAALAAERAVATENPNDESAGTVQKFVARAFLRRKNVEAARRQFGKYLDASQQMNARYGGDYGSYRRKQQVLEVAQEYAEGGLLKESLELLGQYADLPAFQYGDLPVGVALTYVGQLLTRLPARERYDILKSWSFPSEKRQAVRLLGAFASVDALPDVFQAQSTWNRDQQGATAKKAEKRTSVMSPVASTAELLIDAARELALLDELANDLKEPVEKKLDKAQSLALLVAIARDDADAAIPIVQRELEESPKRNVATGRNNRRQIEWSDYLTARACIGRQRLHDFGLRFLRELLAQAKQTNNSDWIARLHYDLGDAARRSSATELNPANGFSLPMWQPVVHATGKSLGKRMSIARDSWWVAVDNHVAHVSGSEADYLYFDCPLTGDFDFSIEVPMNDWNEGSIAYAGLTFEAILGGNNSSKVWPVGRSELLRRARSIDKSDFNRIDLRVRGSQIRCSINGELYFETADASPTSPWLSLFTTWYRKAVFRNPIVTGTPQVPREIALTHGDRMEGWISGFYNETQPPRLSIGQPLENQRDQVTTLDSSPDAYDWSARDGVIYGRKAPSSGSNASSQSRLYYHRPLRAGDSVQYEFYYEDGSVEAHPTIGRIAFLLGPQGVRLHWMTGKNETDPVSGLAASNVFDGSPIHGGASGLPLKSGEWNLARISLQEKEAVIELNGSEIYRQPLDESNERFFGVFHDPRRTATRLRNVVMTGKWPAQFTPELLKAAFVGRTDETPTASHKAIRTIIGEKYFSMSDEIVRHKAEELPLDERYAYLRDWVLPGGDHDVFQLHGTFESLNPPRTGNGLRSNPSSASGRRVVTGGRLMAPAMDLVAVARDIKKLPELERLVREAPVADEFGERSQLALRALIAIAQQDDSAADKSLEQLRALAEKVPADSPEFERWPEVVAASQALELPSLRRRAFEILELLNAHIQKKSIGPKFDTPVRALRARASFLSLPEEQTASVYNDPPLQQWSRVVHDSARSRGWGAPPSLWQTGKGAAGHAGGHREDFLYFQSPLRGNFEVHCRLPSKAGRDTQFHYAGSLLTLAESRKSCELLNFGRNISSDAIEPVLADLGEWYDYRLAIQGGKYTVWVNDRKIHEHSLPANPDPWLAVHWPAISAGGVRDLQIKGEPSIPESLDLTELPDLTAWLADYYSESITGETPDWKRDGEEIVGRKNDQLTAGSHRQRLLRYHRPLLEDGELEYEFYYDPGKSHVAPAVDRLALLLEPSGVRVHWITDAQFDSSGLASDNVADEPANRRGPSLLPLRERDWNRAKISLRGDVLSVSLNDQLIVERPLEPDNQRMFGFFHFADQTEVRVRKVLYRGAWPRTLPAIGQQELADQR